VLEFRRGAKKLGVGKGESARVESIDAKNNALNIVTPDGSHVLHPDRLKGFETYRPEERTLAVGDRIQFRAPDRGLKVANGEFAEIVAIDNKRAVLRLDNDREITAGLSHLRHIDHGYCSTSHSSQGATVDRVLINVDSIRSDALVNNRQFYVSISRARFDAKIYTDDRQAMGLAVARKPEKSIALDAVRERRAEELRQSQRPTMRMSF
jgi:ATP-dependent exoDNAse (exonuclease V) alpha subunit